MIPLALKHNSMYFYIIIILNKTNQTDKPNEPTKQQQQNQKEKKKSQTNKKIVCIFLHNNCHNINRNLSCLN